MPVTASVLSIVTYYLYLFRRGGFVWYAYIITMDYAVLAY